MQKVFITKNSKQTQKLGEILAKELKSGAIICLVGELGSGKTTFAQGLLKGLKIKGPHTSPTFLIMKEYKKEKKNIYHIDAYRIKAQDILNLGWQEIITNSKNIVIIEWADRICEIIPVCAIWIEFSWLGEKERKIILNSKFKNQKSK